MNQLMMKLFIEQPRIHRVCKKYKICNFASEVGKISLAKQFGYFGWMDGWMDESMDGWMETRMDG